MLSRSVRDDDGGFGHNCETLHVTALTIGFEKVAGVDLSYRYM